MDKSLSNIFLGAVTSALYEWVIYPTGITEVLFHETMSGES
jgi:hypothetical protein